VEGMQVITGIAKTEQTAKVTRPFGMPTPPRDRSMRRGGL
jgi:hypothetical protein